MFRLGRFHYFDSFMRSDIKKRTCFTFIINASSGFDCRRCVNACVTNKRETCPFFKKLDVRNKS